MLTEERKNIMATQAHAVSSGQALKKKIFLNKFLTVFWKIFRALLLIALGYILVYPLFYMLSMTFRDAQDMYDVTVTWIPKHFTMENLARVWDAMEFPAAFGRTLLFSVFCSLFSLVTCSLAGYGLARFKFKGSGALFALMLFTIIVPGQFFILPTYLNFSSFTNITNIQILNTPLSMILPAMLGTGIRSGLYIYIFRQFFKGMPRELEEAAYMDGCGYMSTFLRIMVPSAVSAFVTCFLFSFVWNWNDYQISSMLMETKKTLSSALLSLRSVLLNSEITGEQPDVTRVLVDLQAGSLLVVTPVLALYLVLQRFFVESIERTGLVE